MPKRSRHRQSEKNYWWRDEIADLHRQVLAKRRKAQLKRTRADVDVAVVEAEGQVINIDELRSVVCSLGNCKAPGSDWIAVEVFKLIVSEHPYILLNIL